MTIKDEIFGEIEYELGWSKVINLDFLGNLTEVNLLIDGEVDGQFDKGQYAAFQSLMKKWNDIQKQLVPSILAYYRQKRNDLGFDIEVSENYPSVEAADELLTMITIDGIVIPYADIFDGRDIRITFQCTWDEENGLGVRLLNEKVADIGFQDVAM
ncbi:DUF2004 domain-containing protein [Jeotgalibacillus sp. ET6]|uniref:DUF6985 domain-containing protein n=1 Tax=Jeotgalibacillus sp. ET6 TaxID=3037260 RepID=UPI0024187669|nr:DUF2004 domain-containing protein [Jeotgalibacillus sp. ET6]MDG5471428.1 DUF2004 domain-containing protein [Jeotgalibacillus sp. ET6]